MHFNLVFHNNEIICLKYHVKYFQKYRTKKYITKYKP